MGYILDSLFGLRHSAGAAVPSVLKNEWSYWSEEEDTVRVTKEKTDGDRWCHGKNINTAIWCLILPSLPLTFLALVVLIVGPSSTRSCCWHVLGICHLILKAHIGARRLADRKRGRVAQSVSHTHTYTHTMLMWHRLCFNCPLKSERTDGQIRNKRNNLYLKYNIFCINTCVVTSSFISLSKTLGTNLNIYLDGKIIFQYLTPSHGHAMTLRGWIKFIYLIRYSCLRAHGSFACWLAWTLNQPLGVLHPHMISK